MSRIADSDALALAERLGLPPKLAFHVGEAAQIMGLSKKTVYGLIDRGELVPKRLLGSKRGMVVPYGEIDRWLRGDAA